MATTSVRDIELILPGSFGKETLSNDGMQNLALGISGAATIALTNADNSLTTDNQGESMRFIQVLTGTLTANVNVIVPAESRVYIADNRTTGAFTVTFKTAAGGGIAVDQGVRTLVYCDGVNVYPVASGTGGGGGSGAPTDATYLVQSPHALLTGERAVTDTPTVAWDFATAGQARAQIPDGAVTYAKLQDVASTRLLGRFTAGAGDVQEVTPGTGLTLDASGVLSVVAGGGAQPLDATLTALAGLATGANQLPYFTGTDTAAQTALTAFARTLLDDADQAAMQTTLGVVPGTTVQPLDATLTALAGVTTGADQLTFFTGTDTATTTTLTPFARSLLDDADAATARATLGVTAGGGATPGGTSGQVQYNSAGSFGGSSALTLDATSLLTLAPLTTKGDMLVQGTSAPTRLPVGTDGQVLTADAAQPAGVTWATAAAGGGSGGVPSDGATVTRAATQAIANGGTPTAISFDTEVRDEAAYWNPGEPSRLTLPASGWYTVTIRVDWAASPNGSRDIAIRVNDTTDVYTTRSNTTGGGTPYYQTLAATLYASPGDSLTMRVYQNSGAALTLTARVDIMRAGSGVASTFLALTDTPDAYTGQGGNLVTVTSGATGLDYTPLTAFARTLLDDADAATARATLGVPATAAVQPLDATLTALAGLATGADQLPYFSGTDIAAQTPLTAAGRALLDDADAAAQRATLALGTMAQQDASAVAITDGKISVGGHAPTGVLDVQGNVAASDVANLYSGVRLWPLAPSSNLSVQGVRVEASTGAGVSTENFIGIAVLDQPAMTTAWGMYSGIALGTGRYNIRAEGTAQNYFAGNVGIANSTPSYPLDVTGAVRVMGRLGLLTAPNLNTIALSYDRDLGSGISISPSNDTGGGPAIVFNNAAFGAVGSITTSATATAYNTSSDVRLKHSIAPLTDSLATIAQLNPISHRWNADDSYAENFLAHALQRVLPYAVTGEPDALNPDGSIAPQQVDASKLIPRLVGAVKELLAQVEALTARVATLEEALGL